MTEPKTDDRPSQVTVAGIMAVVASVLLVATLFESMAQLRSVEMRESIEEFLSRPPGEGLGLSVAGTIEILRVLMLVSGAAAAVTFVLGIYVLQRNKAARIGFTLAAAVIVLTSPISGGFLGVLIAFSALMLWTAPARNWFAGRSVTSARPDAFAAQDQGGSTAWSPEAAPPADPPQPHSSGSYPVPPPTQGFGTSQPPQGQQLPPQSETAQQALQPTQQHPQAYGGHQAGPQQSPDKRPVTVTIAAVLTWIFAGLTLVAFGFIVLALAAAKDQFLEAVQQQPGYDQLDVEPNDMVAALWVLSAVIIFWCLASIVLAAFAWRRSNPARIALVVSAASAALLGLGGIPVSLLNILAAIATVALLFLGGANQWYSPRTGPRGYPPQPDYPPQGGYPDPNQQPPSQDEQKRPKNVW